MSVCVGVCVVSMESYHGSRISEIRVYPGPGVTE